MTFELATVLVGLVLVTADKHDVDAGITPNRRHESVMLLAFGVDEDNRISNVLSHVVPFYSRRQAGK